MSKDTQVQDEPNAAQVANATQAAGAGSNGTLTKPSVDAEKLQADYEAKIAKFEKDMNAMKSSLQKREAELTREWQTRNAELQRELEKYALEGMDDEQRKQYEARRTTEQMQQLQQQLEQFKVEKEQAEANLGAFHFFMSKGVPAEVLVTNDGYDALWQSGMGWIDSELTRLKTVAAAPPKVETPAPPTPPDVNVDSGATPSSAPTWSDLEKKYGDQETVYRMVEQGQLPPSIIPGGDE